jgi:hypothetical protein
MPRFARRLPGNMRMRRFFKQAFLTAWRNLYTSVVVVGGSDFGKNHNLPLT